LPACAGNKKPRCDCDGVEASLTLLGTLGLSTD
jgi:hypothetical protein